ncbi:MAG: CocE/NonD family hydrolase [bacterium]|nr:CocE/NonD family hydrolase [bacterium]
MTVRTEFPREVREERYLRIPVSRGRCLAGRMWLPVDSGHDPVPAIVEAIPYRRLDGTIIQDAVTHPWWAGHGYASIRLDLAGSGDSDGVLLDEYLACEQDDLCEALAWIAGQPWCSGATGMVGISWGGFAALQIAARRPPSLKAIITCCSTDDRYRDDVHYMGGCLLNDSISWGSGIFSCLSRWPDPLIVGEAWREMWRERLETTGCPMIDWFRHQRRDAFWKHGSISENPAAIEAAVFVVGGWTDGYTNAALRMMERLQAPRRALIGPWTHVYPHFGFPGEPVGFLQESLRWWDRWLKGMENGIDHEPALTVWMQEEATPHPMHPVIGGHWMNVDAWPPATSSRCFFPGDGTLDGEPSRDMAHRVSTLLSGGLAGGEWCPRDGGGLGPEFASDQAVDDMLSLVFDSAVLAEPLAILGAPEVTLDLASDRAQAQVAVRLCEVTPEGRSVRVSFGLLNLSHRHSHEWPAPMIPGERERVVVKLNDTAWRFHPGNRIRLAIATGYWPMAWPSPETVTLTLNVAGSMLQLPVIQETKVATAPPGPEFAEDHPVTVLEEGDARLTVTRDLGLDEVQLHRIDDSGRVRLDDIGLVVSKRSEETFGIREGDPSSARTDMVRIARAERGDWQPSTDTRIVVTCDSESFHIAATLEAFEHDRRVLVRRWNESVPRDHM